MHQAVYAVCVILELFVLHAGSTNVEHRPGLRSVYMAKRSSESTWACHAGCKKFCLPSCKKSCCAPGAQPYQPGMFNQLINYQETLPPPQMHPPMQGPPMQPPMMPPQQPGGQCAQGCPQSCAPSCQPQCCSGGQMGAQQPNPYMQQPNPYGYQQQQQQQGGRNYQTGLASPAHQGGRSYAEGLAGNAAYQDARDMYDVHIPSAFERLKARQKQNPRYKPAERAKPKRKVPTKRFRHRFYDKEGNPHDEIVYDGARCDPSCRKLCEPSCRFECCVGAAPYKKKVTKKISKLRPVPTLVSPIQADDGKLTYPYADVTQAPAQPAAQNEPAQQEQVAQSEQPAQPQQPAQLEQPAQSEQPVQPAQEGVAAEDNTDFAGPYDGGVYGGNRGPGQYPGYGQTRYPPQQGQYGRYPSAHHGRPNMHPGYPPQNPHQRYPPHQGYPPQTPGYPPQTPGYPPQNPGYPPQQTNPTGSPGASYAQGLSQPPQNQQQCPAPCPQACAPSCSQQCCSPPPPPPMQQSCGGGCSGSCAPQCAPKCCWDRKRSKIPKSRKWD